MQKLAILSLIYVLVPTLVLVSNMTWITFLVLRWLEIPLILIAFSLHNLELSWVGKAAWCGDLGQPDYDPQQMDLKNEKRKNDFELGNFQHPGAYATNKR